MEFSGGVKRVLAGLVLAIATGLAAPAQEAGEAGEAAGACGAAPVTIAQMQWPSAAVLAHIHAMLVSQELGCPAEVVQGDLGATSSSMASTGRPMVAPEMWLGRIPEIWNSAVSAKRVRPGAASFTDGALEGWFIPDFVAEAWPELISVEDLREHLPSFQVEGAGRPRFISCPPDWACALINRNLLRAHGLENSFEIVEPANRFEMDQLIADVMSRQQPALFYYWQPNGILAQFDLKALDMGAYNAEAMACLAQRQCADPQPSAFVPEQVLIAMSEDLYLDAPQVAQYFQQASMPLDALNAVLEWQNRQQASVEDAAAYFIESYPSVWQAWLGT